MTVKDQRPAQAAEPVSPKKPMQGASSSEVVRDINRRIVEWRRIPVGPPIHVRLVNADDLVARWRAARSAKTAPKPAPGLADGPHSQASPSQAGQPAPEGKPRRSRWWRSRRRAG